MSILHILPYPFKTRRYINIQILEKSGTNSAKFMAGYYLEAWTRVQLRGCSSNRAWHVRKLSILLFAAAVICNRQEYCVNVDAHTVIYTFKGIGHTLEFYKQTAAVGGSRPWCNLHQEAHLPCLCSYQYECEYVGNLENTFMAIRLQMILSMARKVAWKRSCANK